MKVNQLRGPLLFLLLSEFVLSLLAVAWANDGDAAAKLRIKQNVPNLLVPAGSIVRIDLKLTDGKSEKKGTIRDQKTIIFICSGLREIILQDHFNIGRQRHQPSRTLEITFIHKEKPPVRLSWVGMSNYWMSWNREMLEKHHEINFQSERFDRVFFSNAYLDLFQRMN